MIINSENIANAWEESISLLIKNGEWIPAERGNRTKELRNVLFSIKTPQSSPQISEKYIFPREFLEDYSNNYLLSEKSSGTVAERTNNLGPANFNQLERISEILSRHYYSRRAVVSIWIQDEDLFSNHPPCINSMQFLIRNNSLEITAVLRSNDAWFAALPDLMAINKVQQKIAKKLNLAIGNMNMLSVSYHIYEMDLLIAMNDF